MEPTDLNRKAFDNLHRRRGAGGQGLPAIVRQTLGDVTGRRVLHLPDGAAGASAELAELGAIVTALEPSEAMLEAARSTWPTILWIGAGAEGLPAEVRRGRFDLAYSPEGALAQVADLDAWADGLAQALRPRGELLIFDEHPVSQCVDGLQRWHVDYFDDSVKRLGRIVTACARAGFGLEALEEYPGEAAARRADRRVPAFFLLYARRG